MPPAWWTHVVFDRAQAPVSTQDAKLVFEFITRRLVERDGSGDTRGAQCDMWIETLDGVTTVGDLHEAIEAFGPDAGGRSWSRGVLVGRGRHSAT